MNVDNRLKKLEDKAKSNSKTDGIFDEGNPTHRYVKSLCDQYHIPYDSNIVPIWKRFLITGDDNVPGT